MLLEQRAAPIQHMQKALQQMNVQLTQVLSDITGVTGMLIIRAIVAGERNPQVLAEFRNGRCQHSAADIAKALTGNYRPEHLLRTHCPGVTANERLLRVTRTCGVGR